MNNREITVCFISCDLPISVFIHALQPSPVFIRSPVCPIIKLDQTHHNMSNQTIALPMVYILNCTGNREPNSGKFTEFISKHARAG